MNMSFRLSTPAAVAAMLLGCRSAVLAELDKPAEGMPVVISSSKFDIDNNEQMETIEIALVGGRRYNNTVAGPSMGEIWEGWFRIRVRDCSGDIISDRSLNDLMRLGRYPVSEMWFRTPEFRLVFDDYNGDGQVDFNLGEYRTSNFWSYRLFTIGPDGTVRRLNIEGADNALPISDPYVSTEAITVRGSGFIQSSHYHNGYGYDFHQLHEWDGERFALIDQKMGVAGFLQEVPSPSEHATGSN